MSAQESEALIAELRSAWPGLYDPGTCVGVVGGRHAPGSAPRLCPWCAIRSALDLLAAVERDTARLDWLEDADYLDAMRVYEAGNLRAAIDAALGARQEGKP